MSVKQSDSEVKFIGEDPDPSIKLIVERAQKDSHETRRMLGIVLPNIPITQRSKPSGW
jgi:hypothetical protein